MTAAHDVDETGCLFGQIMPPFFDVSKTKNGSTRSIKGVYGYRYRYADYFCSFFLYVNKKPASLLQSRFPILR